MATGLTCAAPANPAMPPAGSHEIGSGYPAYFPIERSLDPSPQPTNRADTLAQPRGTAGMNAMIATNASTNKVMSLTITAYFSPNIT